MTILDGLDRSSVEFVAKSQLRAYGQFLQEFHDSVKNSTDGIPVVEAAPILVNPTPRESCSLRDLVRSGNVVLDKIMTALVVVCREAALLKQEAEKKFYPALIIYGEGETVPSGGSSEASALTTMAEFLSLLQELSCFVERCSEVVRNIMWQLAGLYHNNPQPLVSMSDVHLPVVWEALAKVLSVLLTLDEIIARQPYLKEHFELYLKSARLVHHNPKKFALDETRLKFLDNLLAKLDAQIMSGFILQNCADQPFDTDSMHVNRNSALMEEFAWIIKHFYSRADARLGDLGDREQCWLLTGTSGLYVLYLCIFRTLDKKLFKLLWQSFKKVSAIPLIGDIMWSPCDFLYRKVPESEKVVDKRTLQTPLLQCSEYLTTKTQSLSKECQTLTLQVTGWLAQLANFKTWSVNVNAELDVRSNHILTGLRLAFYIGRLVQFILNGHALEKRPLSKQAADSVFRLIELLKAIENEVYRRWMIILETVTHVSQRMTGTLLSLVTSAKESVRSDKKKSNRNVDMLAALLLGQNALSGPPTEERLLVLALALQFGGYGKILKSDDLAAASNLLDKLDLLTHLDAKFRDACSCSCLLLHRTIFPSYFESALKSAADADRMQYFFCGLNDCLTALNAARHTKVDQLKQKFEDDFANIFQTNFLEKLYESIENDLRLCIHTHLQLEDRNPFVVQLRVHTPILHVPALRLGNRYIDIKRCVEQYLERTFYNLTTVALHDWRTYAEMRQLAKQKYGLDLVDPHLPSQTLEQGLDVLEIMRNIHIFVAKYLYNLNNQVFIEHTSNNKHLNVLNIRHIANSIRTHGTGIMSTTVNFTYQFLRKKFYVFSQFLYDDHIKSKLIKDVRYFREHKEKLGGMFPFEKAEKFNRSIRKLGLTPDGLSYFDQFRQLITQIGNALGYVRMVRSGGLQACAQAIQFIPDLDDVVPFAPLVDEKASAETKGAAQAFDTLVGNLIKNFTTGTEYFKLFVEVFAPEFRNQKHVHLKNFYILVPALTVNFVEHVTACKEKINRKGQEGAAFTDDGFSMGVAYILKLLDQYDEFDSLHWFRSVKEKYAKEKDEVEKQQRGETSGGADVKLSQTLTLTMKRIEHYSREFDLVSFSLRSARVFFRTDALLELIPKEKDISDSVSDTASVANMPTS